MMQIMMNLPNWTDPDNGCESGGELVSAQTVTCIHGGHNLYTLQAYKLQIGIIETIVCQHLEQVMITLGIALFNSQNILWLRLVEVY